MKVKKEMLLMDYLLLSYNRKNAKNLLKYKQVYVNNQQISQFDYLLHENDQVEIKKENTSSLEILYEDQEFVVINKPSGLLSMSDGKEKEKTAYHYVSEYLKKQDKKQKSKTKKLPKQIRPDFNILVNYDYCFHYFFDNNRISAFNNNQTLIVRFLKKFVNLSLNFSHGFVEVFKIIFSIQHCLAEFCFAFFHQIFVIFCFG